MVSTTGDAEDGTKRVLFVCTANVCRSPMAEAIFNALAEDAGMPHAASSAGVAALKGEPMTPHARAALEEVGVYADGHRARQADGAMLEGADLVLAMTPRHVEKLLGLSAASSGKIHTLPGYVGGGLAAEEGIPDPYGHSMAAYRASVRQIFGYVDLLVARLKS
jgi:protein-tyrosine phosphatase